MTSEPRPATPRPDEADVRRMLEGVVDPELNDNIVSLGMVRGIAISPAGVVTVHVALTISGCPLRTQIRDDVASKVRALPGVTEVKVEFGEMTGPERSELMGRVRWKARESAPDTEVPVNTRVLAIASGKGGVGKSSITVNLAMALAMQGFTVGVLDADIWGFSVHRMLGASGRLGGHEGKIDPHVVDVPGAAGGRAGQIKIITMGNLVDDEATALMWRGLMLSKALEQFLTDVRWGPMDYLLIDMPPGTGDIQMALSRLLPRSELLIITTPALAAQKVAARVADMARRSYLKIVGVVENMSAFICDHGTAYAVFGAGGGQALADDLGVELIGQVPIEPQVSATGDAGRPVVAADPTSPAARELTRIAQRVSSDLLPPMDLSGCTARVFEVALANLAAADALKQAGVDANKEALA